MGSIKCMLILVLFNIGLSSCRVREVREGGTFTTECRAISGSFDYVYKFYREKYNFKVFTSTRGISRVPISDGQSIRNGLPPRFSVTYYNNPNQGPRFTIRDVVDLDSGPYGCEAVSTNGGPTVSGITDELRVESSNVYAYWTTSDDSLPKPAFLLKQLADNAEVAVDSTNPKLYCVVVTGITDPMVNVTFGKYQTASSKAIKTTIESPNGQSVSENGFYVRFVAAAKFRPVFNRNAPDQGEGQPLYCRAETAETVSERYVRPLIRRKPHDELQCDPGEVEGELGEKVTLTCQIKLYPTVSVEWHLPAGPIARSGIQTNEISSDTVETKLTIDKLTSSDLGRYSVRITNELGSKDMRIILKTEAEEEEEEDDSSGQVRQMPVPSVLLLGLMVTIINVAGQEWKI